MPVRLRRALDALQWGEGRHLADLEFLVVDRAVPGGQRTLSGKDLKGRDASYLIMADGTQLPFHRVVEVHLEGRTVWKKRTREPKAAAEGEGEGGGEGDELGLLGLGEPGKGKAAAEGAKRPRKRRAAAEKPAEKPVETPAEKPPEK
jgi:uncharacterized protein (UPF0248 family)